jgi:protein-arginine kinase activator protein McsA
MDNTNSHNLTGRERIELQSRIQKLEWLLTECIGLEEYELCSQIRNIIHNSYQKIDESQR